MTVEIGDIEIDIFQVPGGWGYWFVSPYGNVVTRRDKTSAEHAYNAAKLALRYYTELRPVIKGQPFDAIDELDRTIAYKEKNIAYCTTYFEGVQKRRALDRWSAHNAYRILQGYGDPLPLPEELRPSLANKAT